MKKANGGKEVDERLLFHGTTKIHIDPICHQNFDWRICGNHGIAYGKGKFILNIFTFPNRNNSSGQTFTQCDFFFFSPVHMIHPGGPDTITQNVKIEDDNF